MNGRGSHGRNRLCRIPSRGVIFGVCAGLADYFAIDIAVTRVVVALGALFSFPLVCAAYLLLGLLLPVKTRTEAESEQIDPVEREARSRPHDMLSTVRYRFRDLDSRLQRLEKYVTSNRYKLDREFRQLKE